MTPENPTPRPFAALIVTALLLVTTAAGVSALSRVFQAPLLNTAEENNFHFIESEQTQSTETRTAFYQDSFSRVAPAWLTNAMPGYSSGRAREMWYLSLDRAGDRELRLYDSGGADVMTTNPYRAFQTDFATSPFQSSRAAVSSMALIAPSAPAATGSAIIPAPNTAITSPSPVNGPAVWSATPANGNWNNDANWRPPSPNGPAALAVFGATSISAITISALTEVADIVFGS